MTREQYLTLAEEAYNGGFTVDLAGDHPESGFVVAVSGHERRSYLKPGTVTLDGIAGWIEGYVILDGIAGWIEGYVIQHGAELRKPERYLGAWRDGNDLVLDVVQVVGSKASAMMLGRIRGQDAIYHLDTGDTITLYRGGVVAPKQRVADDDNGRGDERWEDDGGR